MSQSLTIIGKYKNNKRLLVGLHNPQNNRVANENEFIHLKAMIEKYIKPHLSKFKTVKFYVCLQDEWKDREVSSLLQAVKEIKQDKVKNGV